MDPRRVTLTSKINYLRSEDLAKFEDIRVVSEDGKVRMRMILIELWRDLIFLFSSFLTSTLLFWPV